MVALAACGSGPKPPSLTSATARTTAAGSAQFELSVKATLGTALLQTVEAGTVSLRARQAHVYKTTTQGRFEEVIYDGPVEYTNAVAAVALSNPNVKPWLRLRAPGATDVEHVQVLVYLPTGATAVRRVGAEKIGGVETAHYRATIDPRRMHLSPRLQAALTADFGRRPFPADLWVGSDGRLRRVRVERRSPNSKVAIVAGFHDFGARVSVTPPPADEVQSVP